MSNQYDAIIIGAGVIGAATALELARAGWRTLSIDKLPGLALLEQMGRLYWSNR